MYDYRPVYPKKGEKWLSAGLLALAVSLFAVAARPGTPFPALFQLCGVGALAGMTLVICLCLMKSYSYRIEPRQGAAEGTPPDFVITETYGRRITVVCRVSVNSVLSATPWSRENAKAFRRNRHREPCYRYTGLIFAREEYCLAVCENEVSFFVRICADSDLIRLLTTH